MELSAKQYETQLRTEIEHDRQWIEYQRAHHEEFDQNLAEREVNVKERAREMVESDLADAQHRVNVTLADRIARIRVGGTLTVPTLREVSEALAHYGATEDVFRLTNACAVRADAEVALVRLHQQDTNSSEEAAERAAREAVIRRLAQEYRMAEHLANRTLEERLEGRENA